MDHFLQVLALGSGKSRQVVTQGVSDKEKGYSGYGSGKRFRVS